MTEIYEDCDAGIQEGSQLFKIDGTVLNIKPKNGIKFTLEELKTFVNGNIEMYPFNDEYIFILNEEGLIKKMRVNITLKLLTGKTFFGDVILCLQSEIE